MDNQIIAKIKEYEKRLRALEAFNQVRTIRAGDNIIIDEYGLSSLTNFSTDQVINNTGYNTTSASLVDVPGSTLDSFILDRPAKVQITAQAQLMNPSYSIDGSEVKLVCNDSIEGDLMTIYAGSQWLMNDIDIDITEDEYGYITGISTGWSTLNDYMPRAITATFDFSAGTHTLKLRYNKEGNGTAYIGLYLLSYMILGK